MRKLDKDKKEQIQVGDVIQHNHAFGTSSHKVHRVTKKYAFVKYNDVAEGKYPIIYSWGFESLPREKWNMVQYTVWRNENE